MRRIHVADLTLDESGCSAKSNFHNTLGRVAVGQMVRPVSVRVFPNDSFWGLGCQAAFHWLPAELYAGRIPAIR